MISLPLFFVNIIGIFFSLIIVDSEQASYDGNSPDQRRFRSVIDIFIDAFLKPSFKPTSRSSALEFDTMKTPSLKSIYFLK